MLNHTSIATTVKYYAKHDPDLVRDLKRNVAAGQTKKKVSAKVSASKLRIVS
jgi:hypothetical protein